jgi:hypothetical protein
MRIRIQASGVIRSLERLRDAFRVAGRNAHAFVDLAQQFQEGGLIRQPEPVHLNPPGSPESQVAWHHPTPGREDCPICRHLPQGVLAERAPAGWVPMPMGELLPHRAENCPVCRERLLSDPRLWPMIEHSEEATPCQHAEERDRIACSYGYCVDHPRNGLVLTPEERTALRPIPINSGSTPLNWLAIGILPNTGTAARTHEAAPSYTAESAIEEIRLAGERPNEGLAARYRPVEGPTAACSACPALVAPEELWVGKKSGIALCDPCMTKWEKAGRAKRTGEF